MPDQVFSLLSSGPFPLSDLLGSYHTRLAQTATDDICIFLFENRVFIWFVLGLRLRAFELSRNVEPLLMVLWSQKWLDRTFDDLCDVLHRTRAVMYCVSQRKAASLGPLNIKSSQGTTALSDFQGIQASSTLYTENGQGEVINLTDQRHQIATASTRLDQDPPR